MLKTNIARNETDLVLECIGAAPGYFCGDCNDWHAASPRMIGDADVGLQKPATFRKQR